MMTVERAEREMEIAEGMTKGLWAPHSRVTAVNARIIAENCGMDGDKAYILGLLHDIGRRKGSWGVDHIFDGYEYMTGLGEHEIARISMTHSYPEIPNSREYIAAVKCSDERRAFRRHSVRRLRQAYTALRFHIFADGRVHNRKTACGRCASARHERIFGR